MNSCLRTILSLVILALGATASSCATVVTEPSAGLQIALEAKMPPTQVENKTLHAAVGDLRRTLGKTSLIAAVRAVVSSVDDTRCEFPLPSIGIEYLTDDRPQLSVDIPAGTFEQQLDQLVSAYKYAWIASGDWVNFVPADKVKDREYVLNHKTRGDVLVSRDPKLDTRQYSWLEEQGYSVGMEHMGRMMSKFETHCYKPGDIKDPILLFLPTRREEINAHYTVDGKNIWIASIRPVPVKEGEAPGPYKFSITFYANYIGE